MTLKSTSESKRSRALEVLLLVLDFTGTFLFGIEGALAAVTAHLDWFGAMVLAFCTSLGGGIIRDLLIGSIPPNALRDWRYSSLAFAGGAAAISIYRLGSNVPPELLTILDAAGLALFSVAGATKALSFNINPLIAILMGTVTGVGGGTLRDMLLAQVPMVLRADVYATAAMLGAAVTVISLKLKLPLPWAAVLGGVACFALRMTAVAYHWNLPVLSSTYNEKYHQLNCLFTP